jgi:hypothetical protein
VNPYSYILGLDLGQSVDASALAVVKKTTLGLHPTYAVEHLERYPLGTPYTQNPGGPRGIAEQVRDLITGTRVLHGCTLGADETGVGRAVMDILRAMRMPCWLRPITTTSGFEPKLEDDGSIRVPKKDLVGALQIVLQGRRIAIATLPARDPPAGQSGPRRGELSETLRRELQQFRVRVTKAANETFGAESGSHDDLCFALMVAVWLGERGPGATTDLHAGGGHIQPTEGAFGPARAAPRGTFGHTDRPSRGLEGRW